MAESKSTKKPSKKKAAESVDETVEVTAVDEVIEVVEEEPVVEEAPAETPSKGEAEIVEALEKDPKLVGRLKDLLGLDDGEVKQTSEADTITPFHTEVGKWTVDEARTAGLKAEDVAKAFGRKVDELAFFTVRTSVDGVNAIQAYFHGDRTKVAKKIK